MLNFVPRAYHPGEIINRLLGYNDPANQLPVNVRGIGVVIFLIFTVIVGWLAKGLLGRSFIKWAETLVDRTPVVSSIYNGLKQIAETVFAQSETSFDQACLIEYPRRGIWAIGFVSTTAKGEVAALADDGDPLISVFVPTTPNPTSGFLLFFPTSDVKILDMSVEDAAKLVISAGLVYPSGKDPSAPPHS
ncbi:MAG: putative membrane protein [Celeribacter sp.]